MIVSSQVQILARTYTLVTHDNTDYKWRCMPCWPSSLSSVPPRISHWCRSALRWWSLAERPHRTVLTCTYQNCFLQCLPAPRDVLVCSNQ